MNITFDIPAPDALRQLREGLGLSQSELAAELGFGVNGPDVVRAWEAGTRGGKPCAPTPLAWRALRLMAVCKHTLEMGAQGYPDVAITFLRDNLPENLR